MSGLAGKGRVVVSDCVTATWGSDCEAGAARDCAFGCALFRASGSVFSESDAGRRSVRFFWAGKNLGVMDMECSLSELCKCSGVRLHFDAKQDHRTAGAKRTGWGGVGRLPIERLLIGD